jgi:hypothetical protein
VDDLADGLTVLVDVVPCTRDDKPGLRVIVEADQVDAWATANAASLIEQGFVRLVVTER